MGARQSKRSVDITTTPKKEGGANSGESAVIGDAAAPGDGKLERIEESDAKPTTNGIALRTDLTEDKEKDKDEATEKEKDQQSEEAKSEDAKPQESSGDSPVDGAGDVTTPTEANPASPNVATTASSPDSKEPKKKDKMRKKWSLRSISFSKKDKSKPTREETPKNGDVAKEEPLAEGGEEGENAASSPAEEKSTASSPSENESSAPLSSSVVEPKEESATTTTTTTDATKETTTATTTTPTATATTVTETVTASTTATTTTTATASTTSPETETATTTSPLPPPPSSSPVAEEKKEEPTPAPPIPVLLEDKKEEAEKIETEKNVVEVSSAADGRSVVASPVVVSVFRVEPLETPSIIQRKTSEELPAHLPSSPPPSPPPPPPPPPQPTLDEPEPLEQEHRHAVTADSLMDPSVDVLSTPPVPVPTLDPLKIYPPPSPTPRDQRSTASPPCDETVATVANADTAAGPSPEKNALLANPESSVSSVVIAKEELEIVSEPETRVSLETRSSNPSEAIESDQDDRKTVEIAKESEKPKEESAKSEEFQEESEGSVDVVMKSEEIPRGDTMVVDELDPDFEEVVVESCEDVVKEDDSKKDDDVHENDTMEEVLVEAKLAVVIPSEEVKDDVEIVEEIVEDEIVAISTVEAIIPPQEPIETQSTLEATAMLPREETIPSFESVERATNETMVVTEKLADGERDIIEIADIENSSVVPPSMADEVIDDSLPSSPPPSSRSSPPNVVRIASSPVTVIPDEIPPVARSPCIESSESPLPSEEPSTFSLRSRSDNEDVSLPTTESTTRVCFTSSSITTESHQFPPTSDTISAIDVTKSSDRSQILSYDDPSDRILKTESTSSSGLDSYDRSESESKERLAHSPAETENREETSSRRSFNDDASTAIQENHQSSEKSPENEAPVENSALRDVGKASIESVEEVVPKVAAPVPPTVPIEIPPASPPPSVPVITEDVASVTKAIEEIEISDKAVAAAVSEAIECNTNEIIADAHHQNNMNE